MLKYISVTNISHGATCGGCPLHCSQTPAPTTLKNSSLSKPSEAPSVISGSAAKKYNLDFSPPAPSPSSVLRVRIMLSLYR